jgi:hypothetical protein
VGEKKKCVTVGRKSSALSFRRYWQSGRYQEKRERRIRRHIAANPNDRAALLDLRRIEDNPARCMIGGGTSSLPGTPAAERGR